MDESIGHCRFLQKNFLLSFLDDDDDVLSEERTGEKTEEKSDKSSGVKIMMERPGALIAWLLKRYTFLGLYA